MALADLYGWLVVDSGGSHALLDLTCHGQEGLLDVGGVLCGSLQEGDTEAVGEFLQLLTGRLEAFQWVAYLGYCVLHDLLVRHITLVADQQLVDALSGVSVNLLQPLLDVVEGVHICDIVDDANTMGTSVV